ncbi:hypothetical protein SS50377_23102 [Spironucleus salmonicida]|nr:hypothetical protein SS50377_23102 [Spironucleus salmonicida]
MDHEFNARNIILLKKYKAQAEQKENEVKSRIRAQQNANMASFGLLKKLRIGFQHPTYLPNDQEMVKIRQITTEKQRIIGQAEEVKNLKIRRNIERIQQVKQEHIRNRSLKGEELKLENTRTVALIKNAKQTMLQDQEYVKNLKIRNQI